MSKITIQDILNMPLQNLKKMTVEDFISICNNNNLDFAEVVKQVKIKFAVQDIEQQNKQPIYSNLSDGEAIVFEAENSISIDEYFQIHQQAPNEQTEQFIINSLQNGFSISTIQRYFRIGFAKASKIADKLIYDNIAYKSNTNYKVIDNQKFIQQVCSKDFLNI